jgi:hypothetical protein
VAKPFLELLGGVLTVVYGYFALLFVTPLLQKIFPELPGFSLLSAGLVMGIMIIPYVSSMAEDAMRAVPMHLREGSYAMGATRFQTAVRVVMPGAFSGIAAAYILGISRAVGGNDGGCDSSGNAAKSHVESDGACRYHHRLYRSGKSGRSAAWQYRIPDYLCSGIDPAAYNAGIQYYRASSAQALPRGILKHVSNPVSMTSSFHF